MFKIRNQKCLYYLARLSRFLVWFIPIYITLCFAICSYGGLRFLYSHLSGEFVKLSDQEKVSLLDDTQVTFCLCAFSIGILICILQGVLMLLIQRKERDYENEIEVLKKQLSEEAAINLKLTAENQILSNQLKVLSILRQNIVNVLQNYLDSVAASLRFTGKERMTLYIIDPERKSFNVVRRYAHNSDWRKWTEVSCPVDVGVRGRAWEKGCHYIGTLPDYDEDPVKYKEQSRKFGYTDDEIDAFKMKARTCFAYRYDSCNKQDHHAVIVIESMSAHYKSKQELRKEIQKCGNLVYHLIKDFYDFIPRAPIATKEGL